MNLLVDLNVGGNLNVPGLAQLDKSISRLTRYMRRLTNNSAALRKNMHGVARNTRNSEASAYQMARRLDLMNRSATKLRNSFIALAGGGLAGAAIGTFIGRLAEVNDEFTKTQVRLAGLLVQNGNAKDFTEGRLKAKGLQKDLAFASAATPGTSQEFTNAFIRLQSATGIDYQRTKALTRGLLVGGDAVRGAEGRKNIVNDIQQALTSGISPRQTADLFTFLQSKGVTEAGFDALNKSGRLKAIEDAIGKLGPEIEALEQTFGFQATTTKSLIEQLTVAASGKFVDGVSGVLGAGNDFVMRYFVDFQRVLEGFAPTLAALALSGTLAFGVFAGLTTMLSLLAAAIVLAAPGLATLFGGATVATGVGAAAVGGLFSAGLVPALGAILLAVTTLAIPLTIVGTAFAAIGAAAASVAVFLYRTPTALQLLGKTFETFLFQVQRFAYGIRDAIVGLYLALEPVLIWLGGYAVNGILYALDALARFLRLVVDFGYVLGSIFKYVSAFRDLSNAKSPMQAADAAIRMQLFKDEAFGRAAIALNVGRKLDLFPGGDPTGDLGVPNQITNINGDVNVNIKADTIDDPQRVAVAFETVLDEIASRKRGATRSGVRGR